MRTLLLGNNSRSPQTDGLGVEDRIPRDAPLRASVNNTHSGFWTTPFQERGREDHAAYLTTDDNPGRIGGGQRETENASINQSEELPGNTLGGTSASTPIAPNQAINGAPHQGARRNRPRGNNQRRQKQKKNTRASIKIATLNMQGRGANSIYNENNKWHSINRMIRDNAIGILALQETHLDEPQKEEINAFYDKIKIISSSNQNHANAMGVAFAINKRKTADKDLKSYNLIPGRALMIETPWHNTDLLRILNIYAPNNPTENTNFWIDLEELWGNPTSTLPFPDIVLGDFNLTEDAIDRASNRIDDPKAREALFNFKTTLGIVDGWRQTYPNEREFSLVRRGELSHQQSRIDRIYSTPYILNGLERWETRQTPIMTDHKIVTTHLTHQKLPYIGKGRWTVPAHVILNRKYIQEIEDKGMELQRKLLDQISNPHLRTSELNPQTLHRELKNTIKSKAKPYAQRPTSQLEKETKELELLIKMTNNDPILSPEQKAEETGKMESQRKRLEERIAQEKKFKCEASYAIEAETMSKGWTAQGKENKPRDTITKLRRRNSPEGEESYATSSKEMAELTRDYHNDIQTNDLEIEDNPQANEVLDKVIDVIDTKLNNNQHNELNKRITQTEISIALQSASNGKAPGIDGIPYELYKILRERHLNLAKLERPSFNIQRFLAYTFNDIAEFGITPESDFNEGWMCPIYKKKDKLDIANYRPITILNTDYKLMTKALQAKLALQAPKIIHKDQAGFMKERSITDHIKTVILLTEHAEATETNDGMVVALDQEKAYDRIKHEYLWKIMRAMNLPDHFIKTIRNLYTNAHTRVMINGVLSSPFKVTRGVRQGDPISCLLFNIAIEPLAILIRKSNIKGYEIPRIGVRLKLQLFADDTSIYLSKEDSFEDLNRILEKWCLVSGAKFNVDKTEIIPLGTEVYRNYLINNRKMKPEDPPLPQNIRITKEGESIRFLGARVGNHTDEIENWSFTMDKMNISLERWGHCKMTLEGKRLVVQMVIGGTTQYLTRAQGMSKRTEKALTKIESKFVWSNGRATIGLNKLRTPIELGGRKLLDIETRNMAAAAINMKSYLQTGPNRPYWALLLDDLLRMAYDKKWSQRIEDPRINPFIQNWPPPNNMNSLPKHAKQLFNLAKKMRIKVLINSATEKIKNQMSAWYHPGKLLTAHYNTYNPKSIHLRVTHGIKTILDANRTARKLTNTTHMHSNDCDCDECDAERNILGCGTPHECAIHAEKLINNLEEPWKPTRLSGNENHPIEEPEPRNELEEFKNQNKIYKLDEIFRILVPKNITETTLYNRIDYTEQDTLDEPLINAPGEEEQLTIYTDGSCENNGFEEAAAGSGIYYGQNDERNRATRVTGNSPTNNTAELDAVRIVLTTTPRNKDIIIKTDSQYVIKALKDARKHEDNDWQNTKNKELLKETVNALRARSGKTRLEWVKGHNGEPGNEAADELARLGATLPLVLGPPTRSKNTITEGLKLTKATQSKLYKALLDGSKTVQEKSPQENLERIKSDIKDRYGCTPLNKSIWTDLKKNKNITRKIKEFLYKAIKGALKIGKFWENIPNVEDRSRCETCGSRDDIEHILTRCEAPGQKEAWEAAEEIWLNQTDETWWKPSLGEILGCASTSKKKYNINRIDNPKTRMWQILISETTYVIWALRCKRVIDNKNQRNKWTTRQETRKTIKKKLNKRIRMDCIATNENRYKKKALNKDLVKCTWRDILEDNNNSRSDWVSSSGVLVGINIKLRCSVPATDHG